MTAENLALKNIFCKCSNAEAFLYPNFHFPIPERFTFLHKINITAMVLKYQLLKVTKIL